MIFEGATINDLKEHGTPVKTIIVESEEHGIPSTATTENKEILINAFFEDEDRNSIFKRRHRRSVSSSIPKKGK